MWAVHFTQFSSKRNRWVPSSARVQTLYLHAQWRFVVLSPSTSGASIEAFDDISRRILPFLRRQKGPRFKIFVTAQNWFRVQIKLSRMGTWRIRSWIAFGLFGIFIPCPDRFRTWTWTKLELWHNWLLENRGRIGKYRILTKEYNLFTPKKTMCELFLKLPNEFEFELGITNEELLLPTLNLCIDFAKGRHAFVVDRKDPITGFLLPCSIFTDRIHWGHNLYYFPDRTCLVSFYPIPIDFQTERPSWDWKVIKSWVDLRSPFCWPSVWKINGQKRWRPTSFTCIQIQAQTLW